MSQGTVTMDCGSTTAEDRAGVEIEQLARAGGRKGGIAMKPTNFTRVVAWMTVLLSTVACRNENAGANDTTTAGRSATGGAEAVLGGSRADNSGGVPSEVDSVASAGKGYDTITNESGGAANGNDAGGAGQWSRGGNGSNTELTNSGGIPGGDSVSTASNGGAVAVGGMPSSVSGGAVTTAGATALVEGGATAAGQGSVETTGGSAPVASVPQALADTFTTEQDRTLTIEAPGVLANDSSVSLSVSGVTAPAQGTLVLNSDGSFRYVPAESGYVGTDEFTYRACEGTSCTTETKVTLYIEALPVAVADEYLVAPNDTLVADSASGVLSNDSLSAKSASILTEPEHGTLTFAPDGSFTYVPSTDFHGLDEFSYQAFNDAVSTPTLSDAATVTLIVDQSPTAADDSYALLSGTELSVAASGVIGNDTDADSDSLVAEVVVAPVYGTLALSESGAFTYTPNADFVGADSFTYVASDSLVFSNVATVSLTVAPALFFSEYIEGSSYNKALELYNPHGVAVVLDGCLVRLYSNGATTPTTSLELSGNLGSGEVLVLCYPSTAINQAIADQCDISSAVTNFNGDDALELYCDGITTDVFGQIGSDPGSAWGTSLTITQDATLLRKATISRGNPAGFDDPAGEWDGYAQDTFGYLGSYDVSE